MRIRCGRGEISWWWGLGGWSERELIMEGRVCLGSEGVFERLVEMMRVIDEWKHGQVDEGEEPVS